MTGKLTSNFNSKASSRAFLLIMVLTLTLFSISLASGMEFDNIKSYDDKTRTVTIENVFGLGRTLADIKLETPLEVIVPMGYQKIAEFTLDSYDDEYLDAFNKMEFQDITQDYKVFERAFDYKYWGEREIIVNDYERVCEESKNESKGIYCRDEVSGTHIEKEFAWIDLDTSRIIKGTYRIGIFMQINYGDKIEWVGTYFGKEVKEWATVLQSSGTETIDGDYTINTFTSNGYFNISSDALNISYLVVAGGGGGKAGGGGAGGMLQNVSGFELPVGDYVVVVGTGGVGVIRDYPYVSGNGTNSTFHNIEAFGGGGGAGTDNHNMTNAASGGSGGGNAFGDADFRGKGKGLAGQGNDGETGTNWNNPFCSGGGGGAGAGATICSDGISTAGGAGLSSSVFNGTALFYAGGGGGGNYVNGGTAGAGGKGGGGAGVNGGAGTNGVANTGGGGGGVNFGQTGGNGGDGIIIIRYVTADVGAPTDPPSVTLNDPPNNTQLATNVVDMNCTVFDGGAVVNVSLILDGALNETDSSGLNNTLYNFNKIVSIEEHNWTCRAFDNSSESTEAGIRLFDINMSVGTVLQSPTEAQDFTTSLINFVYNSTTINQDLLATNFTVWFSNGSHAFTNGTGLTGSSPVQNSFSLTLLDNSYIWTANTTGTATTNETINRTFTVHTMPVTIVINNPTGTNDFISIGDSVTLDWNVTEAGENLSSHVTNCSYTYNGIQTYLDNVSQCVELNTTTFVYASGANTIRLTVEEEFGLITNETNSFDYRIEKFSETFTTPVIEGSSNNFELKIKTNGSVVSIANLSYNATRNIGTAINTAGNNFTLSKVIIAPTVSVTSNSSFFWNIIQIGGFNYNLTAQNQTITNIGADDCTANTRVLYNFTIVSEAAQSKLTAIENTSGKIDLSIWSVDRSISLTNFSQFYNKTNPMNVCLNDTLGAATFVLDAQIEYDADDYDREFYNIQNETLNNDLFNTNITLYDLLTSTSQAFKLVVKDTSFLALGNAIIEVQRKYIDEGVFKIVEIPLTDAQGETTANLVVSDVVYNFVIKKFGETILTVNNVIPVCQTPLISTCLIQFNAFSTDLTVPDFESEADFNYTLGFNSSSRVVSSIYNIPSGVPATIVLTVIREDALGTAMCSDTLTSASGTLSCVVPNSFGNSTALAKLTRGGVEVAKGNIKLDQDPSDIYGTSLLFLGLFVMLTLIGASMSDNPVFTIIFMMLGVILLFAVNLVANNGFIGGTATILWFIIAVIILVIKGARRN